MIAGVLEPLPPTEDKTTNWSTYNDVLRRRGSGGLWGDPEMIWIPPPSGKRVPSLPAYPDGTDPLTLRIPPRAMLSNIQPGSGCTDLN